LGKLDLVSSNTQEGDYPPRELVKRKEVINALSLNMGFPLGKPRLFLSTTK
jgi:hypothetical protein